MKYLLVLYYRLSLKDYDKEEMDSSNSIENQKKLLQSYVASHQELSKYEVVEFVDDGYSGTNFNRPGFSRMMELARMGVIKIIIVKDLSRFGRNYIEVGTYLETLFPFLKIRFISVLDHFDSQYQTATGDINLGFKNIRCDYYSKWLSKKEKQVKRFRAEKGILCMPPFFGYKTNQEAGRLEIDEPAAEVVRFIFRERLRGKKLVDITKSLNANKVFTPGIRAQQLRGKSADEIKMNNWYVSAVRELLSNQQYTGCSVFGKKKSINYKPIPCGKEEWIIMENHHDAIIPKHLFDAVQRTFTSRDTRKKRPQDKITALFVGKVVCGCCGKNYRKRAENIYFCKSREYFEADNQCPNVRIKEEQLREMVLQSLKYQLSVIEKGLCDESLCDCMEKECNESTHDKKRLENEIIKLYENFSSGIITKDEYLLERAKLDEEKNFYQKEAEKEKRNLTIIEHRRDYYNLLQKYALFAPGDLTREIINKLIVRIVVYNKDRIEIIWKYQDVYEEMLLMEK